MLFNEPITFTEDEAHGIIHPYKDAIVVSLKIAGQKVHRVLIDNRSLVDNLFSSILDQMNLVSHTFTLVRTPLYGFLGESVYIDGKLDLPIELGDAPR